MDKRLFDKDYLLTCKLCNKKFESIKDLDSHIKTHKVKREDYYTKHFKKHDICTNEPILYKNSEFYLTSLFNNKVNLRNYFKQIDEKLTKKLIFRLLHLRKQFKDYENLLCQVETRSLIMPPTSYIVEKYNIDELCEELFVKRRFCYDINKLSKIAPKQIKKIIIDTREQKPLNFDVETESLKLDHGDYAISVDSDLVIERKSLSDFIQTISKGYDRFNRELSGAREIDRKVVILVEKSLSQSLSFDYIPFYKKFTKAKPDFIFHRVREICQTHDNVQFLFCKDKEECSAITEKLLSLGSKVNNFDLQYFYDNTKFFK